MKKYLYQTLILIGICGGVLFVVGLWAYDEEVGKSEIIKAVFEFNKNDEIPDILPLIEDKVAPLESMFSRIISPNPLNQIAGGGALNFTSVLTTAEIIAETNEERIKADLPALSESTKLNLAARDRVDDMFKRQYFSHTSPDGSGVGEAVSQNNYSYIVVGENLAAGYFKDNNALVKAWMDSPGHKANILARRYYDIGAAAREGMFKGDRVRLAVQIFGAPIDLCPTPNAYLKDKIYNNKKRIDELEPQLAKLKTELDGQKVGLDGAPKKIREYNKLAGEFNNLITTTQTMIKQYNSSVVVFNSCAQNK
ncbi:MAG: hypothetical protein QG665_502 [Patescibacteria group bacterium]|nr:hypothetical protein [Patescibacteria group bacterium]